MSTVSPIPAAGQDSAITLESPKRPRQARLLVILLITACVFSACMVAYNAVRTTFCDDEVNGFFLYTLPASSVVKALQHSIHQDAPLWPVLAHYWIKLSGRNVFLIRLSSVLAWMGVFPAAYLIAKKLAGRNVALLTLIIMALMPYNWVYSTTFRWYSFYTLLVAWNAWAALSISQLGEAGESIGYARRAVGLGAFYAATGVMMMYTNYVSPVMFFWHFLYVAVKHWKSPRSWLPLIPAWAVIAGSFLPWLGTFRAMTHEAVVGLHGITALAVGFFEFLGTPCVAPGYTRGDFGGRGSCRLRGHPGAVEIQGKLFPAVDAGGSLGSDADHRNAYWQTIPDHGVAAEPVPVHRLSFGQPAEVAGLARRLMVAAFAVIVCASVMNEIRFDGWTSYRFLAPLNKVMADVRAQAPNALIITNSNPMMFEAGDLFGFERERMKLLAPEVPVPPISAAYFLSWGFKEDEAPVENYNEAVLIWQCGEEGTFSTGEQTIKRVITDKGVVAYKTQTYMQMNPLFVKYHPFFKNVKDPVLDRMLVVTVYYHKP